MNKASIFINASWIGLGGFALAAAGLIAFPDSGLFLGGWAVTAICNIVMLATRKADEYTIGLWNAGASVAFGTMLVSFLAIPLLEGVYDGLTGGPRQQDIPASIVAILAIMAFNIGLLIKRLLGDA